MNKFLKNFDWTQAILTLLGIGLVIWGVVLISQQHDDKMIPTLAGVVFAGAGIARNGAKKTISKNHDEIVKSVDKIEKKVDYLVDENEKIQERLEKLEKGAKKNDKS